MSTAQIFVWTLLIFINIQSIVKTQSPPLGFAWQYSLWTKHNELRSQIATGQIPSQPFSTNMEYILYESNLEPIPLNHALQCVYTPNPLLNQQTKAIKDDLSFKSHKFDQFGENIAYHSIGPLIDSDKLQNIIETQWFEQYKHYTYDTHSCAANQTCNDYEKLLWAKTRYMACGVSICPSLQMPDGTSLANAAFIVCNYWPSYDKDELPIYKTNITDNECSECAFDRNNQCIDGLCQGCPAPNYNYCQDRLMVCEKSVHKCAKDPIIKDWCTFTCECTAQDWVSDTNCDNLYLSLPTSEPTMEPTNNECKRLGWLSVTDLSSNPSHQCPNGYILPKNNDFVLFVQYNCLLSTDMPQLQTVINGYKPHGIAMSFDIDYDIGCEWDSDYANGVIHTHSGIKCGDGKQLFICVPYTLFNTDAPTVITTQSPSVYPSVNPTINPSVNPTIALVTTQSPSNTPSFIPTNTPTNQPSFTPTYTPTDEPSELDDTDVPTNAPTEGPTFSPTIEPTNEPSDMPTLMPTTLMPVSGMPTTDMPTFETTVAVEYEPFRMYLLFPQTPKEQNRQSKRRLREVSTVKRDMFCEECSVELYPLHSVSKVLSVNGNGFGYQFNLSRNGLSDLQNRNGVSLSRVVYGINVGNDVCEGLSANETLVKFVMYKRDIRKNEWIEMGLDSKGYNVWVSDKGIVIEMNECLLQFEIGYMFVIDVTALRDQCGELTHFVYGKTFGNFNVQRNNFVVNGLKSVVWDSDSEWEEWRYWLKMEMKLD